MEGNARHDNPVLGLSGIILDLKFQVHSLKIEHEAFQQEYLDSLLEREKERPLVAIDNVSQIVRDLLPSTYLLSLPHFLASPHLILKSLL
ncbi:hypothetical protein Ddye_015714 [Dipteronia dyeriana]|uniref:Uncharacterized protein n=1 Tax=Dipteronia dyeriana TaxID=168575 RepID=A0AAD9WZT0_9ROSI|nr:hypothetical protein Ddye_015714 [Dipteronia dyeriana]